MSLAFIVSSDTGEKIEDVIWKMPFVSCLKLVSLSTEKKTGKPIMNHKEKKVAKKQSELVKRIQSGNQ